MKVYIARLDELRRADFYALFDKNCEAGGCYCVAWWLPTWDEWDFQTTDENRSLRDRLFDEGQYDGYLLYADDIPIGWCQCCPRDNLPKIRRTYNLTPDPETWSITCFFIIPAYREIGLAHYFLGGVIGDLTSRGVKKLQGFPKRGENLDASDVWTGPEKLFRKSGFTLEQDDDLHPVYILDLNVRAD